MGHVWQRMSGMACGIVVAFVGGCQPGPDNTSLAGLWAMARGDATAKFTFTAAGGGEVEQNTDGGKLEPLNPDDFPEALADLIAQWNANLEDVNAALDAALPDQVAMAFPQPGVMQFWDPADPAVVASGLIDAQDKYAFIGPLTGGGIGDEQGAGAVLEIATIEGSFDRAAQTTTGQIIRQLAVVLVGANNESLSFGVEISVDYTGLRTGDLP